MDIDGYGIDMEVAEKREGNMERERGTCVGQLSDGDERQGYV